MYPNIFVFRIGKYFYLLLRVRDAFSIHYIIRQRWKCTIDSFRVKTFKLSPEKHKHTFLLPISKLLPIAASWDDLIESEELFKVDN